MNRPNILESLSIQKIGSEFGVFTNRQIFRDSVIEVCAWLPVTQRTQILLSKNDQFLTSKLFPNPDGIEKEREIASRLAELDLQERLDQGLISQAQFKAILLDVVNPDKMMNINSHAILLGHGSVYRRSDSPNINWSYDSTSKLYKFYAVQDIMPNQELTYFSN
jgi:hypothetical protein